MDDVQPSSRSLASIAPSPRPSAVELIAADDPTCCRSANAASSRSRSARPVRAPRSGLRLRFGSHCSPKLRRNASSPPASTYVGLTVRALRAAVVAAVRGRARSSPRSRVESPTETAKIVVVVLRCFRDRLRADNGDLTIAFIPRTEAWAPTPAPGWQWADPAVDADHHSADVGDRVVAVGRTALTGSMRLRIVGAVDRFAPGPTLSRSFACSGGPVCLPEGRALIALPAAARPAVESVPVDLQQLVVDHVLLPGVRRIRCRRIRARPSDAL